MKEVSMLCASNVDNALDMKVPKGNDKVFDEIIAL
jgi:hypothetical protein